MDRIARSRAYDDASDWWGPVWNRASPRSVLDLIETGVIDVPVAAFLWAHLDRRGSLAVVSGPSGAGKTTLLTALADLLPAEERRVYPRGVHEPFAFLTDPAVDPERTALMVNEISPHLPIYLWGTAVRRVLTAAALGFRVLATAHAVSAQDLVAQLARYPLRIPATEVAAFEMVVTLRAWREGDGVRRRLVEITGLEGSERGGVVLRPILPGGGGALDRDAAARWLVRRGGGAAPATVVEAWLDLDERMEALASLQRGDHAAGAIGVALGDRLRLVLERSHGANTASLRSAPNRSGSPPGVEPA